jgi:hypothetical protein
MMRSTLRFHLAFIFLLTGSCSTHNLEEPPFPQQAPITSEVMSYTSTPVIPSTSAATFTLSPVETQASTPIDFSNLPAMIDLILSVEEIESLDQFGSNRLISIADKTKELGNSCLWDCAKHVYSLEHGTLTVILLRAGDPQKAESTVKSLRTEFIKTAGSEYTASDISSLQPKAWAVVDPPSSSRDFRTGAAGIAQGEIVVLVTYSRDFCEYMPNYGRFCEGDIMGLAMTSIEYLNLQVQKLQAAGYQE